MSEYVLAASRKSDLERTELSKEKTGVFTGSYAVHPLTDEKLPIWVTHYVLGSYGGVHHGRARPTNAITNSRKRSIYPSWRLLKNRKALRVCTRAVGR